jgi:serine/threonine-protein kinase
MSKQLSPNTTLSHYRIVSKIGAGAMGDVFLAEDTRLRRRVALKVLPEKIAADADRLLRFEREAFAASALNHPNILTIFEFGAVDNRHFLVSEFVDGVSLRQRLNGDTVTVSETLEIAIQIASALQAAHEAGIIHRDIKPDNLMLRADGYVKVLDFGLAKLAGPSAFAAASASSEGATRKHFQTQAGMIMGTVVYMSPEQARGLEVDKRTDIWSLGCVLYEMLTKQQPFGGNTVIDTLANIIHREPVSIVSLRHDANAELERIINRTLSKNRDGRYQTAKELLGDLKQLQKRLEFEAELEQTVVFDSAEHRSGKPVSPEMSGPNRSADSNSRADAESRGAEPIRNSASTTVPDISRPTTIVSGRRKSVLIIGMTISLVAIAIAAYFFFRNRSSEQIESIAVLPFQNSSADPDAEYLSDGLAESLIYRLSQLPNLKVSPTSSVMRYKGKQADVKAIASELGVSAVMTGRIAQRGDNLTISVELVDVRNNKLLWGEQYERKMAELLATQREIATEIAQKLRLKISGNNEKGLTKHYTENNEAYQLYLKGRFYWNKRTEEGMLKSIEYFQQAIERDPNFALAYSGLADAYDLLAAPDAAGGLPANEAMPKAKAAALKALEIDDALAEPHVSLAHVKYYYDRDWVGAEREYKRAIELNPNYPTAHQWYAVYLMSAGRFDEALAETRRAQELEPLSLPINMTLGWVLLNARQYDRSIEQLRKTLEMDPNFILTHHRLGLVYEQKGMYDEAIAEFRQVRNLSAGKPLGVAPLAHAYALSGKLAEAQKTLAELQKISQQHYVSPASIAIIYAALGDKDQAFAWLQKADKERDGLLARLRVDPRFDSLRSDPRFNDFAKRVGSPQ